MPPIQPKQPSQQSIQITLDKDILEQIDAYCLEEGIIQRDVFFQQAATLVIKNKLAKKAAGNLLKVRLPESLL